MSQDQREGLAAQQALIEVVAEGLHESLPVGSSRSLLTHLADTQVAFGDGRGRYTILVSGGSLTVTRVE